MAAVNQVKERLANGGSVIGTWMQTASPYVANALAHSGMDYVTVDVEHGNQSLESVEAMLYAIETGGSHPMVRMGADVTPGDILRVADLGCQSILVAHVKSAERASEVVRAALYPPAGDRGVAPFTRLHDYDNAELPRRLAEANEQQLAGILIEGRDGLDALDEIVAVPGLDLVYLGIYDLSTSLGVAGQVDHPDVQDLVRGAVAQINAAGLAAGAVCRDDAHMAWLLDNGFRYISYLSEVAVLTRAFRTIRNSYEQLSRIPH